MSRLPAGLLLALAVLLAGSPRADASTGPDPERIVGCYISMGCWNLLQVNEQFTELADSGVNFVIDYALRWPQEPAMQDQFDAYLAIASREGISVAYCLFDALEGATPQNDSEQKRRLLSEVDALRGRPQITAWYVHDEVLPMLSGVDGTAKYSLSLGQMKDIYQSIRRVDSTRPQICVWNQLLDHAEMNRRFGRQHFPYGWSDWMNHEEQYERVLREMIRESCDWVMVDSYPVGAHWLEDGHSHPAIQREVGGLVSRAAQLKSPQQPLIYVFQSFDWKMYGKGSEHARFPSLEQMRCMIDSAYAAGADNVLAYSWFDLVRKLDGRSPAGQRTCHNDLKTLLRELAGRH